MVISASETAAARCGTSLYVHVPFCVVKCGYCDFNSYVVEDKAVHDRFLDALEAELRRCWGGGQPVSVFIGGGTPTLLDPDRLQRLFALLNRHVDLAAVAEVTMEANPESVDAEKLAIARAHGVNRISIGVQSFQQRHLRFLDRAHSADGARAAFHAARSAGFDNVSIDLMFGIPGETFDEWASDLESALALRPDHLSCYSLTFEPGTRLHHELQQGRLATNDEESDRAMFLHTRARLGEAGFEAYEVSNFAGPGGPCRHNDHYWLQGDYVGIGPGASSHRAGVRATNLKPVETWSSAVLVGLPATATAETLRPAQRAGEAVWLGIRRRDGIDLAAIERRLRWPARERYRDLVARHEGAGHLRRVGDRIALTDAGLLFADRVGASFLDVG